MRRLALALAIALLGLLSLAGCARPVTAPRPLPAPPSSVASILGPVPVEYVDTLDVGIPGANYIGIFDPLRRRILVVRGLPPVVRLQVMYHEACHLALFDVGIRHGPPEFMAFMDRVCDAIANSRVAELLAKR
jgi:hypothetical protein